MKKKRTNITRILYIYFIMNFGNRIGEFGLLYYLWVTLSSPMTVGAIFFVSSLMGIISGYIYSQLTRKFKKSKILKLTYLLRTMTFAFFFFYFLSDLNMPFILVLIMMLHSLSDSYTGPLIHSSIVFIVEREQLLKTNSILSLIDNFSLFLSPVIGAVLITLNNDSFSLLFTLVILILLSGLIFVFQWNDIIPHKNDEINTVQLTKSLKEIIK